MADISFDDLIPQQQAQPANAGVSFEDLIPSEDTFQRGMLWPVGKDKVTGEISMAVPGIIKGAYESARDAFTAPGRAMSGELQVMGPDGHVTPEAIAEGANFAMWASPASPASSMPLAPSVKAARPKPEGLQVAEAGERLGVDLPRVVTSDSSTIQQLGKTTSNIPVAGNPLRDASRNAIGQLDDAARAVQEGYGSGSMAGAGSMAREGIETYAKDVLGARVADKYNSVDALVTQNVTTPLENTAKVANDILANRGNAQIAGRSRAVSMVEKALQQPDGLNYQGIKQLRTSIGEMLDNPSLLPAGTSQSELKRIYGSLTDDLKSAVERGGGEKAKLAFEEANTLAATTAKEREALQSILGRTTSDEGLFDRIQAMAGSTSRADQNGLLKVRNAVGNDTWNEISSAVISRLGRAPDGSFSPDRFVTGYGKMSSTGKRMLFGGDEKLAQSLDDIATVSQRFKQLNQYANPSGTSQSVFTGAAGFGLALDPTTTIATVVGGRVASSLMSKPRSASSLAKWAKAYEEAALQPSVKASSLLEARAKILASQIAAETGGKMTMEQVLPAISRIRQVPADNGNEDQGMQEGQQERVPQQPRQLLPNEL